MGHQDWVAMRQTPCTLDLPSLESSTPVQLKNHQRKHQAMEELPVSYRVIYERAHANPLNVTHTTTLRCKPPRARSPSYVGENIKSQGRDGLEGCTCVCLRAYVHYYISTIGDFTFVVHMAEPKRQPKPGHTSHCPPFSVFYLAPSWLNLK
ncbi:uncharacterized protein BCR38DRAFT_179176 [Pseudomassariella vexata]|uniref:Uncharacterized protein n=1 Tax=Pseudomassariella vexata TaxID=1141098 RepID=A0A1Y2E4E0_9PEZI|nr:uncharacterized protein BCR38DRAFT_179176 [Pseudomassariella vexata]ORY66392.1 hypothetical protein BCR38DRAFT_179176 [Pseudomassariella vexata]